MSLQDIHAHRILILDFGSQYTQLIARRRPRRAQWVLRLAICVVSVVVIYSLLLLLRSRGLV